MAFFLDGSLAADVMKQLLEAGSRELVLPARLVTALGRKMPAAVANGRVADADDGVESI